MARKRRQAAALQNASHLTKKKPCGAGFYFGQNWNRTSDTRIFSLEKAVPCPVLDCL
jgi:hypothetical protein